MTQKDTNADVEARLRKLERLAWSVIGGFFVACALGALATWKVESVLTDMSALDKKVVAIQQSLTDHGQTIVSQITNPSSPAQLTLALAQVSADAKNASKEGRSQQPERLNVVSDVVEKATLVHPENPVAWEAAGDLASYRLSSFSIQTQPPPIDCSLENFGPNMDTVTTHDPSTGKTSTTTVQGFAPDMPGLVWVAHTTLKNCILYLDETPSFASSPLGRHFADVKAHHPNGAGNFLVLDSVKVVYRGGPMIPITGIEFRNTVFDIQLTAQPPFRGQSMTRQLLAAVPQGGTLNLQGADL